jgi:hypothetical protein
MKVYASSSLTSEYMVRIGAKFNNLTSYYNLATSFRYNDLEIAETSPGTYTTSVSEYGKDMVYTGGFLKFGYTPTYNLLDYMESINKYSQVAPTFYSSKEYLALPVYLDIPLGPLASENAYIDSNGITQSDTTGNRILFGESLKLEWQSIMLNTFVDVSIYQPSAGNTYETKRLLVMNKYKVENIDGLGISAYVIEFHKKLNFQLGTNFEGGTVDIKSRRSLKLISEDLQELNNIQRSRLDVNYISNDTLGYRNYQRELNFKIPTDSYAKAFLSDADTVDSLSALLYVDYKHELSMNITKLDVAFNIPIGNTADFNGQLFITCLEKHGLSKGEGVVLEFNAGLDSSEYLNQQYLGYRVVTEVYGEYDFTVDLPYGNEVFVGADTGFVKYVKRDPFLNYQPIDLIDIGVDKKGKIAIELSPENVTLKDKTFSLTNVDFTKYRYRLIDGLNIETLSVAYPWILEAEISGAVLGLDTNNGLVWYKGIWEGGRWFGGTWISGTWKYGDWYEGTWHSKTIKDKKLTIEIDQKSSDEFQSTWFTGRWFGGTWNNGTWVSGRFYDGTWNNGVWNNGIWNDGTWNDGRFIGGIWVDGEWNDGIFNTDNEPAYWIDGQWSGGDFENGMWYNGSFETKNAVSRFGTKAYNSRTATWHGGKWLSGSFYSKLGAAAAASEVHKYSIWYTGQWMSGDFYGGIAYNIDFKSGTWHGGILEDIQIIGMDENNNSFILNGIFKFNIGDEFYVIDNEISTELSSFGSNSDPKKYIVLYTVEDSVNKFTEVYMATNISDFSGRYPSYESKSPAINLTIGTNSYGTSSIYIGDAQDNIKDVKVKLNMSSGNMIVEKTVPIIQYKVGVNPWYQGYPFGTSASAILQASPGNPAEPLNLQQSQFLSQNIVGVRLSDSDGVAAFHWGVNPNGYLFGPGTSYFDPGSGFAFVQTGEYILYDEDSTNVLYSTYGESYRALNRVLDPISRDAVTYSVIPTDTFYSFDDEIYSYAIDISEDPSFSSYFGVYSMFEVGMTYSYIAQDLDPDKYYYFRITEVRSSGVGSLKIKLKSPAGLIAEVKPYNKGNTDTDLIGTVFTYDQSNPDLDTGAPIYKGSYRMGLDVSGSIAPGWTGTSSNFLYHAVGMTAISGIYYPAGSTAGNGDWTIYVENTSGVNTAVLEDWELQFGYSDFIGARISNRTAAFDTGLKVVSRYRNATWKTGIWTNGFFEEGVFESGIWYNGIFNGSWG